VAWLVNGEVVDDAAVRDEARMMRPQYMESIGAMDPIDAEMQLREWARENVIERMLLKAAAFSDPAPVPPEVIAKAVEEAKTEAGGKVGCGTRTTDGDVREQAETQYRIERLLMQVQAHVTPPKAKEISEFYKRNKERFVTPELVHAAHIVKNVDEQHDEATARSSIETAYADIRNGCPFSEVADRHSDCAGNGGDLGWFPRGEMVEEFDGVVFALPVGGISEIFQTQFGFHIAAVLERRPAGVRPFKEVENDIAAAILNEKRQKAVENFLDGLRARADIRQGKAAQ
jgi:hypothetical protein